MGMGVAGIILIVGQWIIPENSLRLAQVSPIVLYMSTQFICITTSLTSCYLRIS